MLLTPSLPEPASSIFSGPITNLISIWYVLMKILSRAIAKKKKKKKKKGGGGGGGGGLTMSHFAVLLVFFF